MENGGTLEIIGLLMVIYGKLGIVGCEEQPAPAFLGSKDCPSLKRGLLLSAQPHCTNSNTRAAEGFWQRESLSSGDAETVVGHA